MTPRQPMQCPDCGGEMNHHADKVIAPTDPIDSRAIDPVLGGIVQEAHACPACGAIGMRPAPAEQGD